MQNENNEPIIYINGVSATPGWSFSGRLGTLVELLFAIMEDRACAVKFELKYRLDGESDLAQLTLTSPREDDPEWVCRTYEFDPEKLFASGVDEFGQKCRLYADIAFQELFEDCIESAMRFPERKSRARKQKTETAKTMSTETERCLANMAKTHDLETVNFISAVVARDKKVPSEHSLEPFPNLNPDVSPERVAAMEKAREAMRVPDQETLANEEDDDDAVGVALLRLENARLTGVNDRLGADFDSMTDAYADAAQENTRLRNQLQKTCSAQDRVAELDKELADLSAKYDRVRIVLLAGMLTHPNKKLTDGRKASEWLLAEVTELFGPEAVEALGKITT